MKIVINENPKLSETQIEINCKQANEQVMKMVASLRAFDKKLTGTKDGDTYIIDAEDVFYVDTVDRKTFIYTKDTVYETPLRLYELEERLSASDFFRVGKSIIINLNQVKVLKPDLGGRLLITLNSGEKVMASRQYSAAIKRQLEL